MFAKLRFAVRLPGLGPIDSNGLANQRGLSHAVAAVEDGSRDALADEYSIRRLYRYRRN